MRFYVSFACTFGFGELKLMEGYAKIISLIARDEAQHLALSTHVLKFGLKVKTIRKWQRLLKSAKHEVYDLWRECVAEEKDWAEYLFKDGSMIGLNTELLNQYVEYIANSKTKALNYNAIFDHQLRLIRYRGHSIGCQVQVCRLLRKKQKTNRTLWRHQTRCNYRLYQRI